MNSTQIIPALAVGVAVCAAISDIKTRRIPNRLTYPALLAGLLLQGALHGWQGFLRTITGERRPADLSSSIAARFLAALGENDNAFAELNKAYTNREYFLVWLRVDPRLDSLRGDPRFGDLLRRVGS